MSAFKLTGRALLAILGLTIPAMFYGIAAAQDAPVIGPSGITEAEISPIGGEEAVTETLENLAIPWEENLEAESGAFGGVDVGTGTMRNEPTIAVNPLDPDNVVVAGLFELRVSTDGGATFSAETPAPVPVGFEPAGDPSVAFDSLGRLFWTYLGRATSGRSDVFISQVDPLTGAVLDGYPVNVTDDAGFPASGSNNNDKEWLAADRFAGSPFQDRLYVVWTNFITPSETLVQTTFSEDQGATWSPALDLSVASEGFVWPAHNAVAANGNVYVAYHSQPGFTDNAPDGTSGQVFVLRSTDGGASYPQKNTAFAPGDADITFNIQTDGFARVLPQSVSWTQGSAQPWVLPDPLNASNVYVVAADDPTDGASDDMDIFIARSDNNGSTWSAPDRIDTGPAGTIQFFPTAAIDDWTGAIAVTWYDDRAGVFNPGGINFLLDLFITHSNDGGMTFSPEVQLNDDPFDPDLNPPLRFSGPPQTFRIGEYNGVAVDDGIAFAVWTGSATGIGQHILFDSTPLDVGVNIAGIGLLGGDEVVDEDDLEDGSSANAPALTQMGTFTISAPDGFDDLTIGDVPVVMNGAVTLPGSAIPTTYGELTITAVNLAMGVVSYSYTLTDNTLDHGPADDGENAVFDNIAVHLTDTDIDFDDSTLIIKVIDDVSTAADDADSVTEDGSLVATGNVITAVDPSPADANTTDGVADTAGADGIASISWTGADGSTVAGLYGTLTFEADGNYSYALNNGHAAVQDLMAGETLPDTFDYAIMDSDGDTSLATLTITINGADDGAVAELEIARAKIKCGREDSLQIDGRLVGFDPTMENLDVVISSNLVIFTSIGGTFVPNDFASQGKQFVAEKDFPPIVGVSLGGTKIRISVDDPNVTVFNCDGPPSTSLSLKLNGTMQEIVLVRNRKGDTYRSR